MLFCVGCEPISNIFEPEVRDEKPVIYLYPDAETNPDTDKETEAETDICGGQMDAKPVIYLDPEYKTEITVRLDYNGKLTSTYPAYRDGWRVTATPDGKIFDADGREYYCLFWEGESNVQYDMTKGFVVSGADTEEFLEDALYKLGLNEREANEFIIYWLPKMEHNEYNLISFQSDVYTENAKLIIEPAPDTLIRVFMAYKPLSETIEIEPQTLSGVSREGFTVVEWGGALVE